MGNARAHQLFTRGANGKRTFKTKCPDAINAKYKAIDSLYFAVYFFN